MGSSVKTLVRLMTLTANGHLPPGSAICDIGATQLFGGPVAEDGARSFLDFYSKRTPNATSAAALPAERIKEIAHGGFLGDLLVHAGFRYTALDIFHATNTILFDLNIHAPGPKLAGKFDLVMNFGTTEHVINQLRAFQTIHELTRTGGVIYHDLPMAGYFDHALFRYDPLFFRTVIPANNYLVILQEITTGSQRPVPADLQAMGYREPTVTDIGIEVVVQRQDSSPFRVPMEITTALSVDPTFQDVTADELVALPSGTVVNYGNIATKDATGARRLTRAALRKIKRAIGL